VEPDWWRTWFGPVYLALYDPVLQERTPGEVDAIERLLAIRPPQQILDLACGQGRHSIELARRGYAVTGCDQSRFLLGVARERAAQAGVTVRWVEGDIRQPPPVAGGYDIVVNLFTSFGYFADEADDASVLHAAARLLRPGGRLLIELINGERVIRNFEEREWIPMGEATVLERRRLDREHRRMDVERTIIRAGHEDLTSHSLRLYGGRELAARLREAGFERVDLHGGWDGEPFSDDSLRVVAVATLPSTKVGLR
jgi:D-alanine-D-alanine ligase